MLRVNVIIYTISWDYYGTSSLKVEIFRNKGLTNGFLKNLLFKQLKSGVFNISKYVYIFLKNLQIFFTCHPLAPKASQKGRNFSFPLNDWCKENWSMLQIMYEDVVSWLTISLELQTKCAHFSDNFIRVDFLFKISDLTCHHRCCWYLP